MTWNGKSVLVTGAGGFIGSHLVEALVAAGARVRALVHYNAQGSLASLGLLDSDMLEMVEVVAGDIRDPYAVRKYMEGVEIAFHLAALIGIPYSYVAPSSYVSTNIQGTVNMLEAARAAGVKRIVVTSTSETYGTAQYTPIDEAHPAVAQSPYAATKVAADQLALSYHKTFDLPVTVVRPFNTFGPRQSERAIIPTIVAQAIFERGPIRLGSLEPRRDLTYVRDTVAGFMVLADRDEAVGRATNLGMGESRSVGEMIHTVEKVLGKRYAVIEDPQRIRPERSEVMELCADASFARSLGWVPKVAFEEGVKNIATFIQTKGREASAAKNRYRI